MLLIYQKLKKEKIRFFKGDICIELVTPKKEYMKPLTDRVRNRLYTMAHETKNATKKQKMTISSRAKRSLSILCNTLHTHHQKAK